MIRVECREVEQGPWNGDVEYARVDVGELSEIFLILDIEGVNHHNKKRNESEGDESSRNCFCGLDKESDGKHQACSHNSQHPRGLVDVSHSHPEKFHHHHHQRETHQGRENVLSPFKPIS